MEEEQTNLAANFPEFARVLDEYRVRNGDPLDYRVAITTTGLDQYTVLGSVEVEELGANGAFVDDRCGMPQAPDPGRRPGRPRPPCRSAYS